MSKKKVKRPAIKHERLISVPKRKPKRTTKEVPMPVITSGFGTSGVEQQDETARQALCLIWRELINAQHLFRPMSSPHDGWAKIREEVDELWDIVRSTKAVLRDHERSDMVIECRQIAAMAVRYMVDLLSDKTHEGFESLARDLDVCARLST